MAQVKSWKAEIDMLVVEGTASCRQKFMAEGANVQYENLPESIAKEIEKTVTLLTDKKAESKYIANLEEQVKSLNSRIALMKEAVAAPSKPSVDEMPVEAPKKRGRKS